MLIDAIDRNESKDLINSSNPYINSEKWQRLNKLRAFEYLILFVCEIMEILLVFRLVLKLTAANPASGFVHFIYSVTAGLIWPFAGIFLQPVNYIEPTPILESSTLIAIIVYAVLSWAITRLTAILSGRIPEREIFYEDIT